ncbi:hypothetical protein QTL97_11445 [Sporosarcina thermotolerans]|uniref:Uncharacterized protein n=1 Tax=Sporosarcina thermotolerans TaxID=633404 RepID=A0AAW9AD35_9BACL|nr:hypothetical protein [Sporosarcina thermotolerans]MDW0117553.1 hypothetical protein [Sporosarcina thermotolerans]WHT49714.1 hypothetical protein QNH10_09595 [Sporosarcina thermotolerans]
MKKIIGIFIVVLISIGVADVLQGVILTLMYTPNPNSQGTQEMATYLQYIISAITVTLALWSIHKVKSLVKNPSSSVKVS